MNTITNQNNHPSLQDSFLETLVHDQVPVAIFLLNGIKLHGNIETFDPQVIMLKNNITQMIFKHAISTVVPSRALTTPHSSTTEASE